MGKKKLTIQSRIMKQLGSELVTSDTVALLELIKNSIDAGSKEVRVHSFTSNLIHDKGGFLNSVEDEIQDIIKPYTNKGMMVVEDIGTGMSESDLEEGFLDIGTDIKKSDDNHYLGEKGIGRLAAQKLGKVLVVETSTSRDKDTHVLVFDWDKIVSSGSVEGIEVPYQKISRPSNLDSRSKGGYTRLWILGFNNASLFRYSEQLELFSDVDVSIKKDLKAASLLLISPFKEDVDAKAKITFYHDGMVIKNSFDRNMFLLSETKNSFSMTLTENGLSLYAELGITPWYIKKIHRSTCTPVTRFREMKLPDREYRRLFSEYKLRYDNVLKRVYSEGDLISALREERKKSYSKTINEEALLEYLSNKIESDIQDISPILPISGEVFSYKLDNQTGNIIIDFAEDEYQLGDIYTLDDVRDFMKTYSGVKLYRDFYRIGTLGNQDDDWIQMQQYRTKGQQFYRFNPASTIGYVEISDRAQDYIKEISSRLDMDENSTSLIFKEIIIYLFNTIFFEMNKRANKITKDILSEEGFTQAKTKETITKQTKSTVRLEEENKRLLKELKATRKLLETKVEVRDNEILLAPEAYESIKGTVDKAQTHAENNSKEYKETKLVLAEAKQGLKEIEAEAYNNYKLMANGLITETITHELNTVIGNEEKSDPKVHFDKLKPFLRKENKALYSQDLIPVMHQYNTLNSKVSRLTNLYEFLDKTFITKETFDVYQRERIHETIEQIESNMMEDLKDLGITLEYHTVDACWNLPKGVMLHVFYNLFNNSRYWIDDRQKKAFDNGSFEIEGKDKIVIRQDSASQISIYDSGTGIIRHMENVLFEPLESGKDSDKKRGMGLYIVKQLLESFGAEIYLGDERNQFNNLYVFKIAVPEENIAGGEE